MSGSFSQPGFVAAIAGELAAGRSVALASVLATRGSMPRHEGARLALMEDGRQLGTVGGGALELRALDWCREVLSGAPARRAWVTSGQSRMACGGDALVAVRLLTSADAPAIAGLERLLAQGGSATLEEDWRDACAPTMDVAPAGRLGRPLWDEERARYREPVTAPRKLHVFGAGHVGSALVDMASAVDFEVHVYDDRPELCGPGRLPAAARITCGPFDRISAAAPIGPRDFVVVLTHGHSADELVLGRVLSRPEAPAYAGCIGSRRKAGLSRGRLIEAGVPAERVAAVHMPIGEDIGAVTPQEIAVSITAQLVRCRAEEQEQHHG